MSQPTIAPGVPNLPVVTVSDVNINLDASGVGSGVVNWDPNMPDPFLVLAVLMSPNSTTNHAAAYSVFNDATNRRTNVFLRGGPASTTVTVRVFLF